MGELAKTEAGRVRLGFAAERLERNVAEHIEAAQARQEALAKGENVGDVRSVPVRDPFQSFEPLQVEPVVVQIEPTVADDTGAGSLPSSSLEPVVMP